jgi:hypothetical protein
MHDLTDAQHVCGDGPCGAAQLGRTRAQASTGMHGKIMDGRALVVRLRSEGGRLGGGGGGGERPSRGFAPGENDESKARPARRRSEAGPRVGQAARKRAALRPRKGAPPRAAGRPPGALWSLLPAQSGGPACWAARGGGTSRRPKVAQSPDAICAARGLDSHWMVPLKDRAAHREAAHTADALPHLCPRSLPSPSGPGSPGLTPGRRGAAQVYVAHLSHGANEEQLHRLFSDFGEVVNVRMIVDRDTGQPKGYAFVTMASPAQAQVRAARSASPGRPRPRPAVHSSRGPAAVRFSWARRLPGPAMHPWPDRTRGSARAWCLSRVCWCAASQARAPPPHLARPWPPAERAPVGRRMCGSPGPGKVKRAG